MVRTQLSAVGELLQTSSLIGRAVKETAQFCVMLDGFCALDCFEILQYFVFVNLILNLGFFLDPELGKECGERQYLFLTGLSWSLVHFLLVIDVLGSNAWGTIIIEFEIVLFHV